MKKEIAFKWAGELRSGKYPQGKEVLNSEGKFCCLGVLSEMAFEAGIVDKANRGAFVDYDGEDAEMPESVVEWSGMMTPYGKYGMDEKENLAIANDELDWDFNKIADFVEENWEIL